MALFYKTQFKPFQDKWLTKRKGNFSVMPALEEFATSYLPVYEEIRDDEAKNKFLEYLKLLVFSHRHNKNDAYLKDTIESFDLVRDPMYKYSKSSEKLFFAQPVYAFLFACFSISTAGRTFADEQIMEANGDAARVERMKHELDVMSDQAREALRANNTAVSSILDAYIQRQL